MHSALRSPTPVCERGSLRQRCLLLLQDWVRRGGAGPLGEPRIRSSGFCQPCPQMLNTVNMLGAGSAVSLGVESQKPHSPHQFWRGALLSSPLVLFNPSTDSIGSPSPAAQFSWISPGPGNTKARGRGAFWVPGNRYFLPRHTKQAGWEHWGLAIFWDGGGKHTRAARHQLLFSKNQTILLPLLASHTIWESLKRKQYSLLCHPSRRTRSKFPRMLASPLEAAYQSVRDLS